MGIFKKKESEQPEFVSLVTFNDFAMDNVKVLNNLNMMLTREEGSRVDAFNKAVEMIDGFKNELAIVKQDNKLLKNEINELKNENKENKSDIAKVKEVTYVLATDDGKAKTLTNTINRLVYSKFSVNNKTIKDKLFHRILVDSCYKRLYSQFEINSYKRIKIDDFDEAIKVVQRYFNNEQNIKSVVKKRLKEYIEDRHLPTYKRKMVDEFLEKSDGGNNLWY